jgi:pimeloyl-ACP methyl ester carboxylesterase
VRGFRASYNTIGRPIDLIPEIGIGHDGKTPAQVALNWAICKGAVVPIPGAKSARQADEIDGAELAVIASCGHVPHEECLDAFLEAVEACLAGFPTAG